MIEPLRFEALCVGACSVRLPHGTYVIALGRPGGNATAMAALSVTRDTRVVGHYHSARWRRVLGTTVIATSATVGSLLIFGSAVTCPDEGSCAGNTTAALWGVGILSLGLVSGILLIATGRDEAILE